MNETKYRAAVNKLMNPKLTFNERLGSWASGLCGESAEVDEGIGPCLTFDAIDISKVVDELSDCRWYATALTVTLQVPEWFILDGPNTPLGISPTEHTRLMMRCAGKLNDVVKKVIYHGH